MMLQLPLHVMNHYVLDKQHLANNSKIENILQIVKDIGGLHATGATVPYLSLFSRTRTFTRGKLDDELYLKRSMGKIRCMRKTVYILPKEMIPIAVAATRRIIEPTSEKYAKYLGITQQEYAECSKKILLLLKHKGMTTSEIKKALGTQLKVSPIVNLMCDTGHLIRGNPRGGWKSNIHTYSLFHDYFPDLDLHAVDEGKARKQLVELYLTSYGPVTENDVAWWTGFPKGQIRQILQESQDRISPVKVSDLEDTYFIESSQMPSIQSIKLPTTQVINMLPGLDPYLMGYKDRARYLDHQYYHFIFDRSGNATSTILLDGRVIGIWDLSQGKKPSVKIFLFEQVEDDLVNEIRRKGRMIGQFITDKAVQIQECDSMIPLTKRSAGGVLSPLKKN